MKITIRKGASFVWTLRLETELQRYVPIESITMTEAGARLVAPGHGLIEAWRFRVSRCKGLTRLNTADEAHPRASDWYLATVIDADTVEINTVNTTGDKAYTGGGVLQYGVPMDLTGYAVRAQIRPSERSGTVILDLGLYAIVDVEQHKIDFVVHDDITSAITATIGVIAVELEDPSGSVISLPPVDAVFPAGVVR